VGSDGKPSGKYVDQIDKMTQYSKQLDDTRKTLAGRTVPARWRRGGRQSTALFERIPSPLTVPYDLGKRRSAQRLALDT
jgi:hypothetical protein